MVYQPEAPFPKARGDAIRSADWNGTVNEVVRLDQAKLDKTGGTVSGNLAVNGTISGNLAAGIVGPGQIAPNAVTTDKIPANSIPVDKLLGNYYVRNLSFTLGSGAGTTRLVYVSPPDVIVGQVGSIPTPLIHPVVFVASGTAGIWFSYELQYLTYTDSGSELFAWHGVLFTNKSPTPTQISVTSFNLLL